MLPSGCGHRGRLEHGLARSWRGNLAASGEQTTANLFGERARVRSAGPADIALLKGEGWPDNDGDWKMVHRHSRRAQ